MLPRACVFGSQFGSPAPVQSDPYGSSSPLQHLHTQREMGQVTEPIRVLGECLVTWPCVMTRLIESAFATGDCQLALRCLAHVVARRFGFVFS
jgi:hypothetical protein